MIKKSQIKLMLITYLVILPLLIYDMYVKQGISFKFVGMTLAVIVIYWRFRNQEKEQQKQTEQETDHS